MISNYRRPQLRITNIVQKTSNVPTGRLALIAGPNYRLNRYGLDTSLPAGSTFLAAGATLPLQYVDANGVTQALPLTDAVDTASLALYGIGLELSLATYNGASASKFYLSSLATPSTIYCTSGAYNASHVIAAGTGLIASLYGRPVTVGDIAVITDGSVTRRRTVVALSSSTGSTTAFDQVVLDGPAVDTNALSDNTTPLVIEFRIPYSGVLDPTQTTFTPSAATLAYGASLTVTVPARSSGHTSVAAVDSVGKVFPSYRSLIVPLASEDKFYITSTSDITTFFGAIDIANDIAFGAAAAFAAGLQQPIYAIRTTGLAVSDFNAALAKVASERDLYPIALLTCDQNVMLAGKAHAVAMGQPDVKNWRKIYVGTDSPGAYVVMQYHADGVTTTKATVAGASGNRLITLESGLTDLTTLNLSYGDLFTIGGIAYPINAVISANELTLVGGPAINGTAAAFTITRIDTAQSQMDFISARSIALAGSSSGELITHIWTEHGTAVINGVSTIIPARYLACEYAGARAAALPQQGLTNQDILTIAACPAMYLRYSKTNLDTVAANGTCIITQDGASGPVYVRHQLTTNTSNGPLYYEDNAFAIVHDIDFQVEDALQNRIGKQNAIARTVTQIDNAMFAMLLAATAVDDENIGPEITGSKDLVVALDPILKDTITVRYTIGVPLPLNEIDVTMTATTTL